MVNTLFFYQAKGKHTTNLFYCFQYKAPLSFTLAAMNVAQTDITKLLKVWF